MALSKQQTRLLWIAFALAAAVALAIGTVLWLFPSREIPEDAPFELITSQQSDRLMGVTSPGSHRRPFRLGSAPAPLLLHPRAGADPDPGRRPNRQCVKLLLPGRVPKRPGGTI